MATDINDPGRVIASITDDDKFLMVDAPGTGDGTFATALATTLLTYIGNASVLKTLYDANSILYATSDNTPVALTVGASTVVGRKASGGIAALTVSDLQTLLALAAANISDFSEAVDDRVAALIIEGAGITKTYNDGAGTLTLATDAVGFVTYAAGWPGSRPAYDVVVAVSADPAASAPSWLAAGDFWFPATPYETFSAVSGTTYTYVLTDVGLKKKFTNGSAIAATIPPASSVSWPAGCRINNTPTGAGQITFTAGAGVTIHAEGGALKSRAQYSEQSLHYEGSDVWYLSGGITT